MKVKEILILMCAITTFSTLNYSADNLNNNVAVFSEEAATSLEDAKNKVDMLEYLSIRHKSYYKSLMRENNYPTYLNRAIQYNEQMKPLKIVLDQDEEYRKTDLFINASESDKNAYIAAIDECKSQYNRQPSFSRESDSSIPATADSVKNAKKTIEENSKNSSSTNTNSGTTNTDSNGTTDNTQPTVPPAPPLPGGSTDTSQPSTGTTSPEVENAKSEIDKLANINENHKNYYKNQLTKENASSIVEKARKVDGLMKPIKDAVDEYDKLKETAGYKASSNELKTSYDEKIEQAKEHCNATENFSKYESIFNPLEVLSKSMAKDKKTMAQNGDITTSTSGSSSTTEPTPDPAPNPIPQPDPSTGTGTGSSTNTGDGTGSANPTKALEIDGFTNLTEKFKSYFKNQLTGDETNDAKIVRTARSFDSDLKNIVDIINRENEIKSSQEYSNAKQDETGRTKVSDFETLLEEVKRLYSADDPSPLQAKSGLFSKANSDGRKLKTYEGEIKAYTTSSGSSTSTTPTDDKSSVDKKRKEIKDKLANESPIKFRFTDLQKEKINEKLDSITTISGLEEEWKKIEAMSLKMRDLMTSLREHKGLSLPTANEEIKTKFENLSQELRSEYDKLVEKGQNTTTNETFTPIALLTEQEIDSVINEFKSFKEKFDAFKVDTTFIDYLNEKVSKYDNLNEPQKSKLRQELSNNKDNEEKKEEILDNYDKLNSKMKEALDLLSKNDDDILNNKKISNENKEKYKLAKSNLSDLTKVATTSEELDKLIATLNTVKNDILPFDFSIYENQSIKFSNTDVSIVNRFNDNVFLDVSLINNVSSLYKAFASVKAGVSLNIEKKLNTKIGLFAEYDKKDAHHFSIGTNLTTDYFTAFIRYRLAMVDKLINHNVDSYIGAKYKIDVLDNLKITTNTALLVSYSSKLKLDEKVEMKDKFIYQVEAGAKFEYILNSLTFSLDPKIKYLHDVTNLENVNKEIKIVDNSNFLYDIKFETINEFKNGIKLGGYIGLDGKVTKNPYVNIKLGTSLGYNF